MMNEISATEAFERICLGNITVLDVREKDEFESGRISQAIHNPLSNFDMSLVPASGDVVVVCRSGVRSQRVCEALEAQFQQLFNLQGGMKAWALLGFSMESDFGEPEVI